MSTLRDELTNDPQGLGYQAHLAAGDHQSVAAILNEPRYPTVGARAISSAELLIWGGQAGRLDALRTASESGATAEIRSIADAALRMIQRDGTALDYSRPEIQGMVQALVDAGVFSASDKTSLEALSTADISRAEQLGLGRVTHREVAHAAA